MAAFGGHRLVQVSLPPSRGAEVEYLEPRTFTVIITNTSGGRILVESVDLRFQSDYGAAAVLVQHPCTIELAPDGLGEAQVVVTPSPRFLTNTNEVDVKVWFRTIDGGAVSGELHDETFERASYLLIRNSTKVAGQVFISFKQPEDEPLARLVERYATRAGFSPYLALNDPQPGRSLWRRIRPQLTKSVGIVVLWTRHAAWGSGVQEELSICIRRKLRFMLLLENGARLPSLYDKSIEYRTFDRENPSEVFSDTIARWKARLPSK